MEISSRSRVAAALLSALLFVFASPPWDWWLLAFVALVPLAWALEETTGWEAFRIGWVAGFVLNLLGCPWWAPLFHNFADITWLTSGILTLLVCAYQGLSLGLFAGITRWCVRRSRLPYLLVAPLAIAFAEGVLPYLFKWHLGIAFWRVWPLVQVAELGGPAAVSALLVLINGIAAAAIYGIRMRLTTTKAMIIASSVGLLVVSGGTLRGLQVDRVRDQAARVKVGILQPNFGVVSAEARRLRGRDYMDALRTGSQTLAKGGAQLIVWPESAWPYLFDRSLEREFPVGHPWELRPKVPGLLLFGTLSHDFGGHEVFNSAILSNEERAIVGRYDKVHRLPFGEYIPLQDRFPEWAEKIRAKLPDRPDITPGKQATLLKSGALVIAPLICSDELRPRHAKTLTKNGANLLVAMTSDAWFGDSGALRQHLAVASLRAVENRRDLVRVTNTGLSAHVDATGRVLLEGPQFDVTAKEPHAATLLPTDAALLDSSLIRLAAWRTGYASPFCGVLLLLGSIRKRGRAR